MEPPKVLIIDDEKTNLRLMCEVLRHNGYNILKALHGREGVELAFKYKPDLIISDIMMPEMDGHEVIAKIKAKDEFKDIPVIMITASSQKEDVIKSRKNEATDYILKPISINTLVERVRKILPFDGAGMGVYLQEQEGTIKITPAPQENSKEKNLTKEILHEQSIAETKLKKPVSQNEEHDKEAPINIKDEAIKIIDGFPVYVLPIDEIKPGMITGEPVVTDKGIIIINLGIELTAKLLEKAKSMDIKRMTVRG